MSEQSAEQVLLQLQVNAVNNWFQRDPYIFQVYAAMSPDDRASVIEKVRNDSIERGFLTADMDKWLAHRVNQLYDDGKLPEINKAQVALHQFAQAQEDHAIQNAPMSQVKQYLNENYRTPAVAQMRRESAGTSTDDTEFPG